MQTIDELVKSLSELDKSLFVVQINILMTCNARWWSFQKGWMRIRVVSVVWIPGPPAAPNSCFTSVSSYSYPSSFSVVCEYYIPSSHYHQLSILQIMSKSPSSEICPDTPPSSVPQSPSKLVVFVHVIPVYEVFYTNHRSWREGRRVRNF